MKKINYLALAAAGLLMASCSQDDLQGPATGEGNVHITLSLPAELATRAEFGTGTQAVNLQYAVYEVTGSEGSYTYTNVLDGGKTPFFEGGSLSNTLNLDLLSGKSYAIAFFAESQVAQQEEVYSFNYKAETPNLAVDYSKMTSGENNLDAYDCFYTLWKTGVVNGPISETVYLTRPIAQINWGSNDLDKPLVSNAYPTDFWNSLAITTAAPTAINLFTREAYGEAKPVTIGTFVAPGSGWTYPVSDYSYVAMQYVLATPTSQTYDMTLTIQNAQTGASESRPVAVSNVPLQANFRTNIYGSLLTDAANLTIEIKPGFTGSNNMLLTPWDGTTVTTPAIDASTKTGSISQPSDLAGLAALVNGTADLPDGVTDATFEGYTFTLEDNMDMGGNEFPGIGSGIRSSADVNGNAFKGVFNGNNKTVKNVKVSYDGDNVDAVVGFIPNLSGSGAAVQNVTFENVVIEGGASEQAGVIGTVTGGAKVSNVTVTSGSISSAESAGAVVGRMILTGTIENCNNGTAPGTGASVSGTGNVGGIAGAAYRNTTEAYEMTISNCTNYGSISSTKNDAGGIVGISCANIVGCVNYGTVTGPGNNGGIVAYQVVNGAVKNCINQASGTVTATGAYAGGIIGRVAYGLGAAYEVSNPIEVSGNKNYANVSSSTETGGIVGRFANRGTCENNENYAKSLTATGSSNAMVAGIVANVESGTEVLLTGNTSTTTLEQMTGLKKALIWQGTAAPGSQEGNPTE